MKQLLICCSHCLLKYYSNFYCQNDLVLVYHFGNWQLRSMGSSRFETSFSLVNVHSVCGPFKAVLLNIYKVSMAFKDSQLVLHFFLTFIASIVPLDDFT